jgi:23S rRNA pseudouridine1911/1915/1917 synthase
MNIGKSILVLRNRALEDLSKFKDVQLMSLGSSLSSLGVLTAEDVIALRDEASRRGRVLDSNLGIQSLQFAEILKHIPTVFENEHLAVINKPPGTVVSLGGDLGGSSTRSLIIAKGGPSEEIQATIADLLPLPISKDPRFAHGILHRLDRDTSGTLIVAKSFEAFYDLRMQFACRLVQKYYLALAEGWSEPLQNELTIAVPIKTVKSESENNLFIQSEVSSAEDAKSAKTTIRSMAHLLNVSSGEKLTLVEAQIHTGRTHQIRVHLASIGHPLVHDIKYGGQASANRIMLHANRIAFYDVGSRTSMIRALAPLWGDFVSTIQASQLLRGSIDVI